MNRSILGQVKNFVVSKRSFFLYITIGFTGLTLDLISFILMVRFLHVSEYVANPISMSVGIINNFFLNAYFNFKQTDKLLARLASFYLVGLTGIVVGNVFLWLFNDVLGHSLFEILSFFSPILAKYQLELVKAASIVFIAIMQYFLNKRFSFKK